MLLTVFFVFAPPVPAPRASFSNGSFSNGSWNKPPCFGFGFTRNEESAVATDPSMLSPISIYVYMYIIITYMSIFRFILATDPSMLSPASVESSVIFP